MHVSRRQALGIFAGTAAAGLMGGRAGGVRGQATGAALQLPPIAPGPFKGTRESLTGYRIPSWYGEAKFGMWAHWGPQSAAEFGDWYARRMYIQTDSAYKHHVATYGHPSRFGFKDVVGTWKADKFDAEALIARYKKAGAKYFCTMGVHHDNFDLWDSKYQPRWNAVKSGPKIDIVKMWREAARKQGLKFAVSEHLSNSFAWYATAHTSDKTGDLAGVPYDGQDPRWADLYHDYRGMPENFAATATAMQRVANPAWQLQYFQRVLDLIDQHEPDLLYTDGGIPYGELGYSILAHLYNRSAAKNGGTVGAIYTSKSRGDAAAGICVLDVERGLVDSIWPQPWQTDTCIGSWHYDKGVYERDRYKTPKTIVDMLCDIVSRNGNLMLNIPLPNSGMPDDRELKVVDAIGAWMAVNGEGIYGTRPYKIMGDGPSLAAATGSAPATRFNENARKPLTAEDVRFTTKGDALYAFVMGWPGKEAVIPALGGGAKQGVGRIVNVELLGAGKVPFVQERGALRVTLPEKQPSEHAVCLKIAGA